MELLRTIPLLTGDLQLSVTRAEVPLEQLCDFAARDNPKRGFLFVSKVLGRHLPTRPSVMRNAQRLLSRKIPSDLPGPVVILGLAETAICLGLGAHEEYLKQTGREDVLFIHTTRHLLDHPKAFEFQEEHSHSTTHSVYLPEALSDRRLLREARCAVLVDDEASTGTTFVNLAKALYQFCSRLEQIYCLTLTDWRGRERSEAASRALPVPARWESLLEGSYQFFPGSGRAPEVRRSSYQRVIQGQQKDGRLGLRVPPSLPSQVLSEIKDRSTGRVLVLGTGELSYSPFRLAEFLENAGCEAYCQATTRSPALLGHAIRSKVTLPNCEGGLGHNFLYNVDPGDYDQIVLCREAYTQDLPLGPLEPLGAHPIYL